MKVIYNGKELDLPNRQGLGDLVETVGKPIAKAFKLQCLDKDGNLHPTSGCAKRKALLNKIKL